MQAIVYHWLCEINMFFQPRWLFCHKLWFHNLIGSSIQISHHVSQLHFDCYWNSPRKCRPTKLKNVLELKSVWSYCIETTSIVFSIYATSLHFTSYLIGLLLRYLKLVPSNFPIKRPVVFLSILNTWRGKLKIMQPVFLHPCFSHPEKRVGNCKNH